MRPIENQTRRNIIEAKERGESREDIAKWLGVSKSAIDRIWRRYKEEGTYLPIPYTGRKSSTSEETDEKIRAAVRDSPDKTLDELIDELSLNLTPSGLHRKLARMGLRYKKNTFPRETKPT